MSSCFFNCNTVNPNFKPDPFPLELTNRWFINTCGIDITGGQNMTNFESISIISGQFLLSTASEFNNQFTILPDYEYLTTRGFTISLWTNNLGVLVSGESRSFIQFKQFDNTYLTFGYRVDASYEIFFSIGNNTQVTGIINLGDRNAWNHLVLAYAPTTWTSLIYLNGALLVTNTNVRDLDISHEQTQVTVGYDALGLTKFTGIIYDLRIHSRPLSIGEIITL